MDSRGSSALSASQPPEPGVRGEGVLRCHAPRLLRHAIATGVAAEASNTTQPEVSAPHGSAVQWLGPDKVTRIF